MNIHHSKQPEEKKPKWQELVIPFNNNPECKMQAGLHLIRKTKPNSLLPEGNLLTGIDMHRLEAKGCLIFQTKGLWKQTRVATFIWQNRL
jgi:hypothetical protein